MKEGYDPRFFISTKEQRDVFALVSESEPQQILEHLFLSSRNGVVSKKQALKDLGVKHIVMCCDRAPDFPSEFEYLKVSVNNERRDSKDQHSKHVHDEDCNHDDGSCSDLNLTKFIVREGKDDTCLAEVLCEWIDARVARGNGVLVHGYDGVSNSAAVVVAYVMWKQRKRFQDALDLVVAARPIVSLPEFLKHDLRVLDTRLAQRNESKTRRIIPKRKNE
jgi:hypothetical protein